MKKIRAAVPAPAPAPDFGFSALWFAYNGLVRDPATLRYEDRSHMYGARMQKRLEALREVMKQWNQSRQVEQLILDEEFPIFELFWWRRIVMDEFHESESWVYRVREMFKAVGAGCRWGLTGTPPVGNLESIKDVAEILWYKEQIADITGAQHFLDEYVRQNSSVLIDEIRIVVHMEYVQHTREERILYRQACHDKGIFDWCRATAV